MFCLLCCGRCEDGVDGSDAPQAGEESLLVNTQHRSRGSEEGSNEVNKVDSKLPSD